jgi:hypothetical protein
MSEPSANTQPGIGQETATTLEQICQGLIAEAQNPASKGLLQLDNSIIQSNCYANLITSMAVKQIPVQVDPKNPATNIYIKNNILYVKGSASLYNGNLPDFVLQLSGEDVSSRTAQANGTLSSLNITALNQLGLIASNPTLPSLNFSNLVLAGSANGTPGATMSLTLQQSSNTWNILPALGISMTGIGISLVRQGLNITFNIIGNFSLAGKQVNIAVNIPASSFEFALWNIQLYGTNKPLISLADLSTLVAGANIFAQLPPGLSDVGGFGLQALQVNFMQSGSSFNIQQVGVTIGCNDWTLGSTGIKISSAGIIMAVNNPFNSKTRNINTMIYGNFQLDPNDPSTALSITMTIPSGNADWMLSASGQISLKNIAAFNHLPGGFNSGNINLPSEVSGAALVIDYFNISFNPGSKQLSFISFSVTMQATWWIVENEFGIANPSVNVYIPGASLPSAPPLSVSASGEILLPDEVMLDVAASYVKNGPWSFTATLATGSQVNLLKLIQKLMGSTVNPPEQLGLNQLAITAFSMGIVSDPANNTRTYTLSGETVANWNTTFGSLPSINAKANFSVKYDGKNTSGAVAVNLVVASLDFTVKYNFTASNNYQLELDWNGFAFVYDSKTNTITSTASDWTLGGILTSLVNTIDPSLDFSLPDPWNMLNSISLNGLTLQLNLTTKQVTITYTLQSPVKLFFINISGLGFTIANGKVMVTISGDYLGGKQIPPWDAVSQQPPAVPGSGNDLFDLKFLALGQHVSLTGIDNVKTVNDAINNYEEFLQPPEQQSNIIPVQKTPANPPKGTLVFDATNNWLIAADFTVAKFYQLQFVFNDPELYGLRIAIAENADYFKNLDFEILYKKITDSIGMYQIDLQLPDQFRHLEFGEVSITLPNVSVQIYTNGNFYIDFGFPASITDFSRSFSIQVFPFVGYGGFYFGVLSGATTSKVPTTTYGQFNPVIVAGLGLSLGVGKTIDEGILSAGLSLTVVGIFQGVLGYYTCYSDSTQKATYYWFQATVGIVGHIYGEINFAIISARLDVIASVYATLTLESHRPIPIYFQANVSVSLSVRINLGLFSIHISLHFSATVSASFTIGNDTWNQALWNNPCTGQHPLPAATIAMRALDITGTPAYKLVWQPLTYDSGLANPPAINLYFIPHLTVAAGNSNYAPQYVAMLYIDTPAATDTTDNSSLGSLSKGVLGWCINAIVNSGNTNTTYSKLVTQDVTLDELQALLCVFNSQTDNQAPFVYNDPANPTTEGNYVWSFFKNYFTNGKGTTINIMPVPDTSNAGNELNAAVFAPFPDLQLQNIYNGKTITSVDFATQSMTGTQNYISDITKIINLLNVNYQAGTANGAPVNSCAADNSGTVQQTNLSLPTFFFTDFIALIAKSMIQNAVKYIQGLPADKNGNPVTTVNIGDLFNNVCTVASTISLSGMASRFLLHGLRLPTPPVAMTGAIEPVYQLTGQQLSIPSTLQKGDSYSVQLSKAAATNWISFNNSSNTVLPVSINDVEIQRIIDTAGVKMTPSIQNGYPAPAINYADKPQAFTLGSAALWQYPKNYYPPLNNSPYILKLPSNLQTELNSLSSVPAFTVQALANTGTNRQPVQVNYFTWATSVDITIQKISLDNSITSPLAGNMYNLIGSDDAGVSFLEKLVSYLNGNPGLIAQVQLLYQPDPASNTKGGYVSALNNTTDNFDQVKIGIIQANLSTETNPEIAARMFAKPDAAAPPPSNTLNTFKDFVTLLWECSIVRSGGYYLYYDEVANGGKGFPDALFSSGSTAKLEVLITFTNFGPASFTNSLVIGDAIDYSNTTVYAQSSKINVRTALLQPGNIGYQLKRNNPGEYVPPTTPVPPSTQEDEIYLENQFNLIGISLPVNPLYQNLLPSGPVDPNDPVTGKSLADPNVWNYSAIIPYNMFVPNAATAWGYTDLYAGIGTQAEMLLNWQDMFGNTLPLASGQSVIQMPVLYTDPIVAVSQWPSVAVTYQFTGDGTADPTFHLNFAFDISRYTTGDQTAINNAAVDLITYIRLWFQLSHSTDMSMYYTMSLNGTQQAPQGPQQQINFADIQSTFIKPIIDYLYAIANKKAPVTPPAVYNKITMQLPVSSVASYSYLLPLTVALTMTRIKNVDPDFNNVPGIAAATTVIQPFVQNTNGATASLVNFAKQFETAFNNPKSSITFKVAAATNISKASSDPVAVPPLRIIRFDSTGKQGIGISYLQDKYSNTQAYYFAPVPLATSLQNFSASVIPYQSGVPFDPTTKGITTNFASIDLDNWGQQFLQAVDKFLSPAYAVPAFLLDNGASLQKVLDAKKTIAEAITGTIDYVITLPKGVTSLANIANAQEKWLQQLLNQLSNAYTYTAAVQTPVTVNSTWSGINNDPPVNGAPPRLYGKMKGTLLTETNNPDQNSGLSAAKLPIANGASWLTYMFESKNGAAPSTSFSEMDFAITHLEWDYESVQGIDGYLASSWLSIVVPQTIPGTFINTGGVEIPVPLKAYPSSPSVTQQSANYPSLLPPKSADPVAMARSWDYLFSYQAPASPQDTTVMQLQLNATPPPKSKPANNGDAPPPPPTLDQALSQFISMYPGLTSDMDTYLVNVQSASDPNAPKAINVVNAFISILNIVATAWHGWNQVNPYKKAAARKNLMEEEKVLPAQVILNYTVEETSLNELPQNPLIINITPFAAQTGLMPMINIAGYNTTTTTTGTVTSYSYNDVTTGQPLLYQDRNKIPARNVVINTLDVMNAQNAWAGLQLQRNLDLLLVPGSTTEWQQTNPYFIYQTPLVMFYTIYQPLFTLPNSTDRELIDISKIPSADGSTPAQRSLPDQMAALFNALTKNIKDVPSLLIKLECQYQYTIKNASIPVAVPVLLLPPYPLTISDKGQACATIMSNAMTLWYNTHNPVTYLGEWKLDIQVFSAFGTNLPMLDIEFYLPLSSILS